MWEEGGGGRGLSQKAVFELFGIFNSKSGNNILFSLFNGLINVIVGLSL